MLKSFRYLFIPFALVYGVIIRLRNLLFDFNIIKSASFNFPIICIGNLAVGGTGKTPMTEYIIEELKNEYKIATLSRGYKRKTKGFAVANNTTTALEIGDEPMQFHRKFPEVVVAVGEERVVAIPQILFQYPNTEAIVLDDAFQHRSVKSGLNILLTDYNNLYTRDLMFPAGDLRDIKSSQKRADIIVVTKCKTNLDDFEKGALIKEINPLSHQKVFFTKMVYSRPYHLFNHVEINIEPKNHILLLCGIANPKPIKKYLSANVHSYDMIKFPDHHIFTTDDLLEIKAQFGKILSSNKIILTTEKDAVRLEKFQNELQYFPIFVLPVKHEFLFNENLEFDNSLRTFIDSFKKSTTISQSLNN